MPRSDDAVPNFYSTSDLGDRILEALETAGKDLGALGRADLAPVDQFHIRGREATEELAGLTGVESGIEALDVGCGIGGSSRYLAEAFGCYVTGLDVTDEYCRVASMLSERVGLDESTEFRCANALDMPFPEESFGLVWTEHAQMNIQDKDGLYAEISRVLKCGGKFAFHDIFAGPGGPPHFPVPWAVEPSMSFLMDPEELRLVLRSVGLEARHWEDVTEESLSWFEAALSQVRKDGWPPLSLQLLTGEDTTVKFENVVRNLAEQRIVVIQAVLQKENDDAL
jgi:ubiquinone/menaquinone biosynthesis C-methylase UbiE